jgi:DNA-binding CsgD family transcriptional regulator/tetratricopeptide (TPR) repeat protein
MRVTSSRFIGRSTELTELEMALGEARDGRPTLAFIAGESGVGKSRLLAEFVARASGQARALGGECLELGDDELPYAPLVAALRPVVRSGDPVIDSLPPPVRAELARLAPELGEPAPARSADGAPEHGGEPRRRLFEALLTLLAGLGEEEPVLFWLEDAHWADRSTRSFLTFLAAGLRDERVLAVVTYRSDELHRRHPMRPLLAELERSPRARRIELPRFQRNEVAVQLEDILGERPAPEVVDRMFGRSEGNPLFTEELIATGPDGRGALPPTLRDALLLRLERLPAEGQSALRALAVAGRADHALLGETSGLDSRALDEAMREAVAANIVVRDDEDRYAFRHALLREVLYDDLLPGERSDVHLAVATALEQRCADGKEGAGLSAATAHHFRAAGDQPKALRAYVVAIVDAKHVGAYAGAASLLDRAIELWDRVDDPEELTGTDRAELLVWAARAHHQDGDEARAVPLLEHAIKGMDESLEPARVASALGELATAEWSIAEAERARATLQRALDLLPEDEASPVRAQLITHRVRMLLLQGRFQDVVEAADEALAAARAAGLEDLRAPILNRLGHALFALGEEAAGEGALRDAIEIARRSGDNDDLATGFINWADCLHSAGRSRDGAELAAEGAREIAPGDRSERWLALSRVEILFDLGQWDEAQRLIPARRLAPSGSIWVNASLRRAQLALGRGDTEAARPLIEDVQEALANSLEPQNIAPTAALRAELERRAGNLAAARSAVDEGLDRLQYCSDDAMRIAQLALAGVSVEADAAQRARDVGDADAERGALARAELMQAQVEAAAEQTPGRPVEAAYLMSANSELARARGEGAAEAAAAEAESWDSLERPYFAAIARWREAEAHVAAGDRRAATAPAAAALATARRLGSLWLAEEVSGLAARARLRLDETVALDDGAGPAAAGEDEPFGLTPRERQVLALVASGATNREIGEQLFMAEKTASVHVSRILRKLEVRSRTEAAAVAHRHGLAEASGVEAPR